MRGNVKKERIKSLVSAVEAKRNDTGKERTFQKGEKIMAGVIEKVWNVVYINR